MRIFMHGKKAQTVTFKAKFLLLVGAEEDKGEHDKDDQQRDHHPDHRRHRHRI